MDKTDSVYMTLLQNIAVLTVQPGKSHIYFVSELIINNLLIQMSGIFNK